MRIALVLIILALLFVTNPGQDAFGRFVEDRADEMVASVAGLVPGGRLLSSIGGSVAGRLVSNYARRDNYFLFSVYTLDFDGPRKEGEEWKFLGIASTFVELQRPETIKRLE